ncbi:MAG TPA: hypothetical protein VGO11_23760 [Chthoniobacteraceae bacterium]|jgi:hypothetical protein|nr:hypothetical protein [Chthoniobacteraceae bacterium]
MVTAPAPVSASEILNRNVFFIKNVVKTFELKTSDKFDLYSPEGELLLLCREPNLGAGARVQRFLGGQYDENGSFDFVISQPETNEQVLRVVRRRGAFSMSVPPAQFYREADHPLCTVKKKWLSISLTFQVFTGGQKPVYEVKVKSSFNSVRFFVNKQVLASMNKRWKGECAAFFKENGFQHALVIDESVPADSILREFLVAFALSFHRLRQ